MDQIKFRGVSKKEKRYVYGWGCFTNDSNKKFIITDDIEDKYNHFEEVESIEQCTALVDKNGKDIYQGDIFQDEEDGAYNFVEWNKSMGGWGTNEWFLPQELVKNAPTLEVIGNTYDNAGLIK